MRLLPLLAILAAGASAERVALSNIGLNIDVPSGWKLSVSSPTSWYLEDTVLVDSNDTWSARHNGILEFEAFTGASASGTTQWTKEDAYAWRLFLENNPCYGWVFRYDSTLVDNRFGMFVQGEWATCPDSSNVDSLGDINAILVRTVAEGDMGWEMTVYSDTADFQAKYYDYLDILDSVRIGSVIGVRGAASRDRAALSVRASASSWIIQSRNGGDLADLRVTDLSGRSAGRLERSGTGWVWHPEGARGVFLATSGGVAGRLTVLR